MPASREPAGEGEADASRQRAPKYPLALRRVRAEVRDGAWWPLREVRQSSVPGASDRMAVVGTRCAEGFGSGMREVSGGHATEWAAIGPFVSLGFIAQSQDRLARLTGTPLRPPPAQASTSARSCPIQRLGMKAAGQWPRDA